jgi:hypothetical protein
MDHYSPLWTRMRRANALSHGFNQVHDITGFLAFASQKEPFVGDVEQRGAFKGGLQLLGHLHAFSSPSRVIAFPHGISPPKTLLLLTDGIFDLYVAPVVRCILKKHERT